VGVSIMLRITPRPWPARMAREEKWLERKTRCGHHQNHYTFFDLFYFFQQAHN
jgi:hypothetical protein